MNVKRERERERFIRPWPNVESCISINEYMMVYYSILHSLV